MFYLLLCSFAFPRSVHYFLKVHQPETLLCSNSSVRRYWCSSSRSSWALWRYRSASASSLQLRAKSLSFQRGYALLLVDATWRLPLLPPAPLFTVSPFSSVLESSLVLQVRGGDFGFALARRRHLWTLFWCSCTKARLSSWVRAVSRIWVDH